MSNMIENYGLDILFKDYDSTKNSLNHIITESKEIRGYYGTPYLFKSMGNMEFWLKTGAGLGFFAGVLFFAAVFLWQNRKEDQPYSTKARLLMGSVSMVFWLLLIGTSSIISLGGVKADYWTHETNGFAYNLYLQLKEIVISEPEEYSVEGLQQQLQEYSSDEAVALAEYPNIIAIMNESFADLEVLGEFSTNREVLPVLHGLKENTIKGARSPLKSVP